MLHHLPCPFDEVRPEELEQIQGICLDIDDTLSTEGKLESGAYSALWKLKEAGFWVVPITGRPAGWCDLIARFWPVHAVIGENGAFTFYLDSSLSSQHSVRRRLDTPKGAPDSELKLKLSALRTRILEKFPQAQLASDQAYREYDLAIDICEDVAPWEEGPIQTLIDLCLSQGAHAKRSSIHVNTWFGDYDKKRGFDHWLSFAQSLGAPSRGNWLYIGDSPNDEPLFEAFDHTVGVANLKQYLHQLKAFPKWITTQSSGAGFQEMATRLLSLRSSNRG